MKALKERGGWLVCLFLWLYLLWQKAPDSGETYVGQMSIVFVFGCLSLIFPLLLLGYSPEVRSAWPWIIGTGIGSYLLVGYLFKEDMGLPRIGDMQ